jgi:SAM-dependent methyltransferase
MLSSIDEKTITDFGDQWTHFTENSGYYGSVDCLQDIFGTLFSCEAIKGMSTAEIGSGSGRIVNMLLDAGAAHVIAIEPSAAFSVLGDNTANRSTQVTLVNKPGSAISTFTDLDLIVSIGVLHHIVDPSDCVQGAYEALRHGGKFVAWVYGFEGNELYLALAQPVRWLSKRLPHSLLSGFCSLLCLPLALYVWLCKFVRLPMCDYMLNHIAKLDHRQRHLTIYDQLNPAYAKYYKKAEAFALLERSGFKNIVQYHRHGYSWTVVGEKA